MSTNSSPNTVEHVFEPEPAKVTLARQVMAREVPALVENLLRQIDARAKQYNTVASAPDRLLLDLVIEQLQERFGC